MRGIGAAAAAARRHAHLPSSYAAAFSSFSGIGGGAGRGSGRGLPPSAPTRAPGSPIPDDDGADPFSSPAPVGRGRGEAVIPTTPIIPSFSPLAGAGRGRGSPIPTPPPGEVAPKQPASTKRFDAPPPSGQEAPTAEASSSEPLPPPPRPLPSSGAGRGGPLKQQPVDRPQEDNRFIRRREEMKAKSASAPAPSGKPKLSTEDAVKRAMELLGGGDDGGRGGGGRGGRGGRGARGRGRGRGRGGRGPADEGDELGIYLGDNADGDRFEKRLGEERMKIFNQAFEEAADNALPDPMEDAYLDAAHTNNMIEFEPEYHVNFGNPDIEEKPPMSLEEMLQKVKPFIVAYEGIQNQEEWEEAEKDVLARAPHMKKLIDMYSGPDVVTAKQQEEELQRVANTLPENIPSSVKRFTDKTLLSLKNNPGWGFDKKCQFMDKFVREVSEQYK
ncbi:hypothetical protein GUJ93_ZPchr0006g43488 [Zizania palustris]|uniref:Hydroxyproline-rich glycoprotein family protein n=1 Tax=Zizania palustris TaxID=103762 RepID=A0A8J5W472_ZIZPA|nr:hypothetical protein GUJ93_ZPchr0006g43488 [Zizania palustris]